MYYRVAHTHTHTHTHTCMSIGLIISIVKADEMWFEWIPESSVSTLATFNKYLRARDTCGRAVW